MAAPLSSDPHQLGASLRLLPGASACSASGCRRHTGLRCDYVDRRGRRCQTAWCPAHRAVVDGEVLCRRHAGVRGALAARITGDAPPDPDLEVRSPSLVRWVSDGVESAVRTLLGAPGVAVASSPVVLVMGVRGGLRAWERSWSSGEHVVRIRVEDDAPDELVVVVDGAETARLAPPWIVDRRGGGDEVARRRFSDSVLGAVRAGLLPAPA